MLLSEAISKKQRRQGYTIGGIVLFFIIITVGCVGYASGYNSQGCQRHASNSTLSRSDSIGRRQLLDFFPSRFPFLCPETTTDGTRKTEITEPSVTTTLAARGEADAWSERTGNLQSPKDNLTTRGLYFYSDRPVVTSLDDSTADKDSMAPKPPSRNDSDAKSSDWEYSGLGPRSVNLTGNPPSRVP